MIDPKHLTTDRNITALRLTVGTNSKPKPKGVMMQAVKRFSLVIMLALVMAMIQTAPPALAVITFKAGHVLAPVHPYQIGMEKFAELVDAKTNGEVKVEVFHSAQLGNERELVEALQMCPSSMCLISSAPMARFSYSFMVCYLPYLSTSPSLHYEVLDVPIAPGSMIGLVTPNVICMAFWSNCFLNIPKSQL